MSHCPSAPTDSVLAAAPRAVVSPHVQIRERGFQHIACFLWCCYFLLAPVYFFESGQPQIADYLMAGIFVCLLLFSRSAMPARTRSVARAMVVLVLYIAIVNGLWAVALRNPQILKFSFFYGFNLMGVVAYLWTYQWIGRRFAAVTAMSVLGSIVGQVLLSHVHLGSHISRATVLFNNPNQLGYHLILGCTIYWIWSQSATRRSWRLLASELAVYACSAYLITQSLSRAAIVALSLLFAFRLVMRQRVQMILAAAVVVLLAPSLGEMQQSITTRFTNKAQDLEHEFYHRGYDRLLHHSDYLVFGAGEGAYDRFRSAHWGELHSSFGTMLFCYGAIGLALGLNVVWQVGRQCGIRSLLFLGPAAAFSLTHNGLRQWEFWFVFAFIVCLHSGSNAILGKRRGGQIRPSAAGGPG